MLRESKWDYVNKLKWFAATGMVTLNAMITHMDQTLKKY